MKTEKFYRFSLQFKANTEERIRAGEFLENLGNRKSTVIVAALNEYILNHPSICDARPQVIINEKLSIQKNQLESMIRDIVSEQISTIPVTQINDIASVPDEISTDDYVNEMLDNLKLFDL